MLEIYMPLVLLTWSSWIEIKIFVFPTLILLCSIVVVDRLAVPLAFAQFARQVLLLLLVVMSQKFLPVIRIYVLLLFDDLPLDLLDLERQRHTSQLNFIYKLSYRAEGKVNSLNVPVAHTGGY